MGRWLFVLALALSAIWFATHFTKSWQADGAEERPDYNFSDRKPIPRPPEIHGWILARVCSVTGKLDHRFSEYVYIKPTFIIAVGNPPTSPDPCVALHGLNGKRLFVEGTLSGVAQMIVDEEEW